MSTLVARPHSPALAPFVASLSYHDEETPLMLERVLPAGRIHLLVNLHEDEFRTFDEFDLATVHRTHGSVLEGPRSQPRVIDTRLQRRLVAVNFKLGAASPFFTSTLSETRDLLVELDQLWGGDGRVLRERLLEANTPEAKLQVLETVLLNHLVRPQDPDPAIEFATLAFDRGASVSEVSSRLGLLPKTFVRRFRERVGLAPKQFSRIRRFQRVLKSIGGPCRVDWSDLAAEHGYTDQAHLIHDFRAFTGITPTSYHPRSLEERNHVPMTSSRG